MRYIAFVILVLQTSLGWGQTLFHVDRTVSDVSRTANGTLFYSPIGIMSDTTVDLPMTWQIVSKRIPAGWATQTATLDSVFSDTLTQGEFVLHGDTIGTIIETVFYPNNIVGIGNVTVKVFVTTDTSQQVTLYFKGTATTPITGIANTNVEPKIAIGPNPTQGEVFVQLPENVQQADAKVFNQLGQLVFTTKVTNGNPFYIGYLPRGIYFVYLSQNGLPLSKAQAIQLF